MLLNISKRSTSQPLNKYKDHDISRYLKGYITIFLHHQQFFLLNQSVPVIKQFKYFRIWLRFRGDIRMESSKFLLCGINDIGKSIIFLRKPTFKNMIFEVPVLHCFPIVHTFHYLTISLKFKSYQRSWQNLLWLRSVRAVFCHDFVFKFLKSQVNIFKILSLSIKML